MIKERDEWLRELQHHPLAIVGKGYFRNGKHFIVQLGATVIRRRLVIPLPDRIN